MNTNQSLTRITTFVALIGCAFAGAHVAAAAGTQMSIDDRAPVQATLLPTLSVVADAANPHAAITWSVADTQPLRVTLMPTIRVTANAEPLAVTLLPSVHVNASAEALAVTTLPTVRVYADALPLAAPAALPALASTLEVAPSIADKINPPPGPNLVVIPR